MAVGETPETPETPEMPKTLSGSDDLVVVDGRALKGKRGFERLRNAWSYSRDGLRAAWAHEDAFRQEVVLAAVLLPIAALLPVAAAERVLLMGSVLLVLIVELLNTALESAIDRHSFEINSLAKQAKDLGSAAVMITLILAALTWGIILIDHWRN